MDGWAAFGIIVWVVLPTVALGPIWLLCLAIQAVLIGPLLLASLFIRQ